MGTFSIHERRGLLSRPTLDTGRPRRQGGPCFPGLRAHCAGDWEALAKEPGDTPHASASLSWARRSKAGTAGGEAGPAAGAARAAGAGAVRAFFWGGPGRTSLPYYMESELSRRAAEAARRENVPLQARELEKSVSASIGWKLMPGAGLWDALPG